MSASAPTNKSQPFTLTDVYKDSGVDTDEADLGLKRLTERIRKTWPGPGMPYSVNLDIGYFANVIDFGGVGLAVCTDGVGSKAMIATKLQKYDTIGIDCVAMNVNDVICVGARPVSMVDYIAIDRVDARILDQIAIGLTEGCIEAGVSLSGGEISQLKGMVTGFDLVGMAVGRVDLDKIIVGQNIQPGDVLIGIESSGIHSNGLSLARRAFFERDDLNFKLSDYFPEFGCDLGSELLRPTYIYVKEVLDVIAQVQSVKALVHITSDGFLNLSRVEARVGYLIDSLPPVPPIFSMIQKLGDVRRGEMFEVYNMGIGFCIVVSPPDAEKVMSIVRKHNKKAYRLGYTVDDPRRRVHLVKEELVGEGKRFHSARSS
jgi:phosphoribosylformylglycinamidine cyclo-ligase